MRITYEGTGKGNSIVGGDSMAKEHAHFLAENTQKRHKGIEVQHALGTLPGISSIYVDSNHHLISVDYDSSRISYDQIENSLNHMGYEITADASLIDTR